MRKCRRNRSTGKNPQMFESKLGGLKKPYSTWCTGDSKSKLHVGLLRLAARSPRPAARKTKLLQPPSLVRHRTHAHVSLLALP